MAVTTNCVSGHSSALATSPILCSVAQLGPERLKQGDIWMRIIRRAVVLAVTFGSIFMAGEAQAGDVKGKVSTQGLSSAEDIAVYIDAIPGKKFDPPAQHATVDQRNMKFVPQTIVISRGTTVDFLNSDNVIHNVHWSSISGDKALAHGLPPVSPGQKQSFQFDHVGTATTLCIFHSDMIGYIVIVPTPYFALTTYDGTFTIKNVPPGTYTLKTWSADGKPTTQSITVTEATTNVDLAVAKK
jgi:plastocyanin